MEKVYEEQREVFQMKNPEVGSPDWLDVTFKFYVTSWSSDYRVNEYFTVWMLV